MFRSKDWFYILFLRFISCLPGTLFNLLLTYFLLSLFAIFLQNKNITNLSGLFWELVMTGIQGTHTGIQGIGGIIIFFNWDRSDTQFQVYDIMI